MLCCMRARVFVHLCVWATYAYRRQRGPTQAAPAWQWSPHRPLPPQNAAELAPLPHRYRHHQHHQEEGRRPAAAQSQGTPSSTRTSATDLHIQRLCFSTFPVLVPSLSW
jgi:hypothetical protein